MPEMTGYGKLSARAYTKSGDKEVYDGTITGLDPDYQYTIKLPDNNGNYYIDTSEVFSPGGNDVQPVNLPFSLTTEYHGVKCVFKWNKPANQKINININIGVIGYKDPMQNIVFNCTISSNKDEVTSNILRGNSIILSYSVVNTDGPVGKYTTRVTSNLTLLNPGIRYVMGKIYYVEGGASANPSSGTIIDSYIEYDWDIRVSVAT